MPTVTVVIPTRYRPEIVQRAIRSVLAQSFTDFEIVVVIDGPDPETFEALKVAVLDPRVQVLQLEQNVGLAEARNVGIRKGTGRYVALLDDDDEWLPEKLQHQVAKAEELGGEYVFVPCRFIEKTRTVERAMPATLPYTAKNFSEYIYCQQGFLQPSMYFASRALFLEVPFTKGLRHIEDTDWLLRATRHPKVQVGSVETPLSIYYNFKDGTRESETTPWKHPLDWAIANHKLFTRRAFPFFLARAVISARRANEPISVFFHMLSVAGKYGTLTPKSLSYFFAYWFIPSETLKKLRTRFQKAT